MRDRGPFGELFRTTRAVKGDKIAAVAERFGVHRESVHAWERGENFPAVELQPAVAEYLGIETAEFMRLVDAWRQTRRVQRASAA